MASLLYLSAFLSVAICVAVAQRCPEECNTGLNALERTRASCEHLYPSCAVKKCKKEGIAHEVLYGYECTRNIISTRLCPEICRTGSSIHLAAEDCETPKYCPRSEKRCEILPCYDVAGRPGRKCGCPLVTPSPSPKPQSCSGICYPGKEGELAMRECRQRPMPICLRTRKECVLQDCVTKDGKPGLTCDCEPAPAPSTSPSPSLVPSASPSPVMSTVPTISPQIKTNCSDICYTEMEDIHKARHECQHKPACPSDQRKTCEFQRCVTVFGKPGYKCGCTSNSCTNVCRVGDLGMEASKNECERTTCGTTRQSCDVHKCKLNGMEGLRCGCKGSSQECPRVCYTHRGGYYSARNDCSHSSCSSRKRCVVRSCADGLKRGWWCTCPM